MRRTVALALAATCLALALATTASAAPPPIRHVFIIVLENKNFQRTFGNASKAPYLARTLTSQGQLLPNYYGIGHNSLTDYIALVSGQSPNPYTQADAPFYVDFASSGTDPDGQEIGQGSIYPAHVKTIADQLLAKGFTWKGSMEDMGTPCRHPAVGAQDTTQNARKDDQYATRHNPFVYFHSIIDVAAVCNANVVDLNRLPADLGSVATTPNYVFITPDLCSDAHDEPCIDGRPGGLASADAFLRDWVPRIVSSPAYQQGGLLIVTFDEAEGGTDPSGDATACCNQKPGPNTPNPGALTPGPGGGRTGTVLLSSWVRPGSINSTPYNHYSLLRSTEDIFGLSHLGYAAQTGLRPFGADVYNGPGPQSVGGPAGCADAALPRPLRGRFGRGVLLGRLRLGRRVGRRTVELRLRHGASLVIRARPAGRARYRRVTGPRRLRACLTYRFALPGRHGHVRLNATSGRGHERRSLRY